MRLSASILFACLLLTGCVIWPPVTRGDTLTITCTNSLGQPDTNSIKVFPIATPINANGSFFITGLPFIMRPDVTGNAVQTNVQKGAYMATNQTLGAILFALPGDGNSYNAAQPGIAISGFNIFNYSPGVQQIVAGNGVSLVPVNGMGIVTITSSGGGSGGSATNANYATNLVSGGTLANIPVIGSAFGLRFNGNWTNIGEMVIYGGLPGQPELTVQANTFGDPAFIIQNGSGQNAFAIDGSGVLWGNGLGLSNIAVATVTFQVVTQALTYTPATNQFGVLDGFTGWYRASDSNLMAWAGTNGFIVESGAQFIGDATGVTNASANRLVSGGTIAGVTVQGSGGANAGIALSGNLTNVGYVWIFGTPSGRSSLEVDGNESDPIMLAKNGSNVPVWEIGNDGTLYGNGAGLTNVTAGSATLTPFYITTTAVNDTGSSSVSNVVSFSIPGGTLGTANRAHIIIRGDLLQNTGSQTNLTLAISYAGSVLWQDTSTVNTRNIREPIIIDLDLCANGSTSAQTIYGRISISNKGGNPTTGEGSFSFGTTTDLMALPRGTSAVNSTTSQTFVLSSQWQSASTSCEFKIDRVEATKY